MIGPMHLRLRYVRTKSGHGRIFGMQHNDLIRWHNGQSVVFYAPAFCEELLRFISVVDLLNGNTFSSESLDHPVGVGE